MNALFRSPLRGSLSLALVATAVVIISAESTYLVTDASGVGAQFYGLGALSGGGGTSAYFRDYPEEQQSLLLDLLFKPSYGASLHILKVEIGGDSQSTEAVEHSHMHTEDDLNMERGYEGWLLAQAKARNPDIKTYGLAWAYPAWTGNGTGSPYGAPALSTRYLVNWVQGIATTWGVNVSYLGQWNEMAPSPDFILALRAALDAAGLYGTGLVGSDRDWSLADAINNSTQLRDALVALGAHYPACSSTPAARQTGLPLWASEDFSDFNRGASHWGAQCWARTVNRNYVYGNITAGIMWHIASVMDERQFWYGASTINAPQPWSGYYEVTSTLWSFAHTTQFSQPGWFYLPLGAGSGNLTGGGTYVALTDPAHAHLTLVVEKIAFVTSMCLHNGLPYETADENATFALGGSYAGLAELQAWYTHYSDGLDGTPTVIFEQMPAMPVLNGTVSLPIRVGDVWTLSTISNASKAAVPASPPRAPFPVPYASDFEGVTPPRAPPLWTDQAGAFEAWASGDADHGVTLRQSVPVHPISWGALGESSDGITPHTILGDGRWTDVNVSVAFMIEPPAGGAGAPGAMVGARASGDLNRMSGVWLSVNASGGWNVSLSSGTIAMDGAQLATGPCAASPPGTWHVLSLNVSGATAAGALDGAPLFSGLDVTGNGSASRSGWAALGTTDFGYVQFDDVFVEGQAAPGGGGALACDPAGRPFGPATNVSLWRCDDSAARGAFDWVPIPGQNTTLYGDPGQLSLRGGDGAGLPLCLAIDGGQAPDGWPLVRLEACNTTSVAPVNLLWVVRADNTVMSPRPWGQPAAFPCLNTGGDWGTFGGAAFVNLRDCGSLSSMLLNWDPVSGLISSEWLPDLCVAACAAAAADGQ